MELSLAELLILMLLLLGATCPMLVILPQFLGLFNGLLLGVYLYAPVSMDCQTPAGDHAPFFHEQSPDSPITSSILLSPEDDQHTHTTNTTSYVPSRTTLCRTLCVLLITLLLAITTYMISTHQVQSDQLLLNHTTTNCQLVHTVLQQPNGYMCEQTCVPYAGLTQAKKRIMANGSCLDNGYKCFVLEAYKGEATSTNTWNTEYKPLVQVYSPSEKCTATGQGGTI